MLAAMKDKGAFGGGRLHERRNLVLGMWNPKTLFERVPLTRQREGHPGHGIESNKRSEAAGPCRYCGGNRWNRDCPHDSWPGTGRVPLGGNICFEDNKGKKGKRRLIRQGFLRKRERYDHGGDRVRALEPMGPGPARLGLEPIRAATRAAKLLGSNAGSARVKARMLREGRERQRQPRRRRHESRVQRAGPKRGGKYM